MQEQLDATTGGKKLAFTTDQRRRLATAGKQLTPDERRKCCRLVELETILDWFRQRAAKKYDSSEARRGRPPKPKDVRKLVVETIKDECLHHFVFFGERHLRQVIKEFMAHYHGERIHQGLGGQLIGKPAGSTNQKGLAAGASAGLGWAEC